MPALHAPCADAVESGFDPERLTRIDAHLQRYVDGGKLPGFELLISRNGRLVHAASAGLRHAGSATPYGHDSIVRLFSMTKPIAAVAAMILYETGVFELTDPVADFIPAFADARVRNDDGTEEAAAEPIQIWHLLTHTAGLMAPEQMYRHVGLGWGGDNQLDLAGCCEAWAALPLAHQPGAAWLYGVSSDVLGRVVEVAAGVPLDEFFRTRIFEPLGMHETWFGVPTDVRDRCAELWHVTAPGAPPTLAPAQVFSPDGMPFLSGGGGLWGTAADYLRFCHFLLGRGAVSDDDGSTVRILGPRTVDYMTRNHLPGGADLNTFAVPVGSAANFAGVGFGLGFSVVDDTVKSRISRSVGEYGWSGAASTVFSCDPAEDVAMVFITQLMPSTTYRIRSQLTQLVAQAIVE